MIRNVNRLLFSGLFFCCVLGSGSLLCGFLCSGSECGSSGGTLLSHSSGFLGIGLHLLCEESLCSGDFLVSLSLRNLAVLCIFLRFPSVETLLRLLLGECALCYTAVEVLHEQYALTGKDVADRVGRLCTHAEPIESTLKIEDDSTRIGVGVVGTDTLDDFAVTRRAAVCYYDVVESVVFVTMTSQTNFCCH